MSRPRRSWKWTDWAQAAADVASGEVHEHQQFELKRDSYGNSEGAKKELAKDVASLAVHGGTLVIGVEEDKSTGRAVRLTPVELAGQVERIRQVCTARIDPPLGMTVTDLPHPDDRTTGLIIIDVPPSPFAPHQVDGRYLGRADRQAHVLSDAEVFHLYRLREVTAASAEQELERAWQKGQEQELGPSTLTVVVAPSPVLQPELLRDHLAHGQMWLNELTEAAQGRADRMRVGLPEGMISWDPHLPFSSRSGRHVPDGYAHIHSWSNQVRSYLEVAESGAVTLVCRDVSDALGEVSSHPQYEKLLDPSEVFTFTAIAIAMFGEIAQRTGLRAPVHLGVRLDSMKGVKVRQEGGRRYWDSRVAYPSDRYQRTTGATPTELVEDVIRVMDRLLGPLARAMGIGDPLRRPSGED